MAKVKTSTTPNQVGKSKTKRPGVHAKTKSSEMKNAKNYKKSYCGQG